MMRTGMFLLALLMISGPLFSQPYGDPDREQPGDEMIQKYLAQEALRLDAQFADDVKSKEIWEANRPRYKEEYFHMLGLWPLPEKTDLKATVTGTLERDGYVVEKLHYQSKPGLYVTANLYRPARQVSRDKSQEPEKKHTTSAGSQPSTLDPQPKYPAVLYVCGHGGGGRDGVKTVYQSHPIWLAKHGFICLIVDTLELGELVAHDIHHGTYDLERWWWHSRGYTSAGVECWNGVRGIDYLLSRDDVDPQNLGVTGISGGGAATFWIAAADERIKCAIPVSGMADLESYVGNRVINGHCDCMFLYNTFQWPWTRIAGLIAPRPMLFMNSDNDRIFPMDANERITNRLERLYSLYGASDKFDTVVSVGGHAYREDLRRAEYAFLQYHLQGKADPITNSEVDLLDDSTKPPKYPIPPAELRVFPTDDDLPKDALNIDIDQHFVPIAQPKLPKKGEYEAWRRVMIDKLHRVAFRSVVTTGMPIEPDKVLTEPWTKRNPPNYVERSHVLLGDTADTHRLRSFVTSVLVSAAKSSQDSAFVVKKTPTEGTGAEGLIKAYAAVFYAELFDRVTLIDPPATHMDLAAPQFLNILRVCDVPDMLGLLAPRPLKIVTPEPEKFARTKAIYQTAGAEAALTIDKPR